MDSKYTMANYQPEFKNQVVELQKHLWSPSADLNTAYLEWKYERNPYLDTPLIYLALYDGEVVGMRGMFGSRWEIGSPSKTFLGLCAEDMVVAPNHRNRGLVTKIMRFALNDLGNRGYSHVFSLSAGAVTFLASLAMGWRKVGSMQRMCWNPNQVSFLQRSRRFIIGHSLFWRFFDKFPSPLHQWAVRQRPLYHLDRKRFRRRFKVSPCLSVQQAPRPEEMADLVRQIGNDGRIRHVRDRTYFSWRFQNPLSRYRFLFWDEAGLKGYLVLQEYVSRYLSRTKVNIVDWEATSVNICAELLRAAITLCDFTEMVAWSATMDGEKKILLRDTGFNPADDSKGMAQHQHCLLVRTVQDEMLDTDWAIDNVPLLDMANWDVRMIFSTMG